MKSIVLILHIIFLSYQAISGELKFSKTNIAQNEKIKIYYHDIDNKFNELTPDLYIYVYNRASVVPTGYNAEIITRSGKNTEYEFHIPENAVFLIFKVVKDNLYDSNHGNLWDIIIKNSDSVDIKDANYLAALSWMNGTGKNGSRVPDFKKVSYLLNKEIEMYPSNLKAEIALLSFKFELGDIDSKEFENRLQKILSNVRMEIENAAEIEVIIKALRLLGKQDRAEEIRKKYITSNPESKLAEEHEFEKLSKVNNFDQFVDRIQFFLKKYPVSDYYEKLVLSLIQSYIQVGRFDELFNWMNASDVKYPEIYFNLSENLLVNDRFINSINQEKRLSVAKQFIESGFSKIREFIAANNQITPIERNKLSDELEARYLTIKSEIYLEEGNLTGVDSVYKLLIDNLEYLSSETLLNIEQIYLKQNNYENILLLTEYDYINNYNIDSLSELNYLSFKSLYPLNNYSSYVDSILTIRNKKKLNELKNTSITKQIELPSLKTLDGNPISLKIFQGRTIIVYSLSYWCDACWDEFAKIESLYEKIREREDLVLIPVVLWSKEKEHVDETIKFRESNNLTVPIYFDLLNDTYKNLSITGVPTIIVINPQSQINYRFDGIKNNDETFNQIHAIIDNLTGE